MTIFKEDKVLGIACGINDSGELFVGGNRSGYNLPDTPKNREKVLKDFDYWTQSSEGRNHLVASQGRSWEPTRAADRLQIHKHLRGDN